jgi:hypothetical protein
MWIGRKITLGRHLQIGEITPSATGHQDFFTNLVGALQDQYVTPAASRSDATHKAGGTGTDDDQVR